MNQHWDLHSCKVTCTRYYSESPLCWSSNLSTCPAFYWRRLVVVIRTREQPVHRSLSVPLSSSPSQYNINIWPNARMDEGDSLPINRHLHQRNCSRNDTHLNTHTPLILCNFYVLRNLWHYLLSCKLIYSA
jgi:hypothetical protein